MDTFGQNVYDYLHKADTTEAWKRQYRSLQINPIASNGALATPPPPSHLGGMAATHVAHCDCCCDCCCSLRLRLHLNVPAQLRLLLLTAIATAAAP